MVSLALFEQRVFGIGRVLPNSVISIGSAMVSWSRRKQGSVAQSIVEAKYVSASDASREAVWLWKLLSDLFDSSLEPVVIHCDNQSCIKISENPVFHDCFRNT